MSEPDDWFVFDAEDFRSTIPGTLPTDEPADLSIVWNAKGIFSMTGMVAHGSGYALAPEPDEIEISAQDWKIIDGAIIESVARGHARRL